MSRITAIALSLVLGFGLGCGECSAAESDPSLVVVAHVNGDGIDARELAEAQQRLRLTVPAGAAQAKAALEACIHSHLVRQLAVKEGLLADSREAAIHHAHEEENRVRQQKIGRHQTVFGPVQLPWEQFRGWYLDRVERALKQRWLERHPPAPGELEAFYATHPAAFTPLGKSTPVSFGKCRDIVERKWTEQGFETWVNSSRPVATVGS